MTAIGNRSSLITSVDCDGYFSNMWQYIERCTVSEGIDDKLQFVETAGFCRGSHYYGTLS